MNHRQYLILLFAGPLLTACQTPAPIRNVAQSVSTVSTQLSSSLTAYVAGDNIQRSEDAEQLANIKKNTMVISADNQADAKVIELVNNQKTIALLTQLRSIPVAATSSSSTAVSDENKRLASSFGKNAVDIAPLTAISKTTAEIAAPRDVKEQATVLQSFLKKIRDNLDKE